MNAIHGFYFEKNVNDFYESLLVDLNQNFKPRNSFYLLKNDIIFETITSLNLKQKIC